MRPRERRDSGQNDLFKARLDQIVDTDHPLAKLGRAIDWGFLEGRFGAAYSDKAGHPPLPTRLMAGLSILKHMHDLSDEDLCARWVENPYYQLFCGEEFFQHKLTFDCSSLTRWRQRTGEEKLVALIQESLSVATRTGAAKPADFSKVIVDTTVQPKAVAFPTDAKLMHRARERLVKLAKKTGVSLRQSYERIGKHALIAHQRYAQAKQFKRANRLLKTIRTYLGRITRDITRKIKDDAELESVFAHPLMLARRVREQRQHQRGKKVYSLHAPEVECIGKGKAHRPYEFGVKVSLATTLHRSKGGQFIAHAKALPGNPYDGHTLATVIPEIETQIGMNLARIVADRGYRGHNAPPDHKFKVYISGQRRRVTETIKRELRRRSAVEPVIGHSKAEHRMGRNYLAGTHGDAANAVLAAAGYNFRRLLEWLALLLSLIAGRTEPRRPLSIIRSNPPEGVLHGRLIERADPEQRYRSRVTSRAPPCSTRASHPGGPSSPVRLGLGLQEILEPVDIVLAVLHVRVAHEGAKQRQRRLDAFDDEFIERSPQPHQRFGARSAVNDQLADQGIIIGRDHVTLIGRRIDADAETAGGVKVGNSSRRGLKSARMLGVDAAFNRGPKETNVILRDG